MGRWLPRWTDIAVAALLLTMTEAELWYVAPDGVLPVMAVGLAVGCAAVAFRRAAPLPASLISLTGVMVVPALADVDAATTLGWLVVALLMSASLGYHGRQPRAGLSAVLLLVAGAIAVDQGPAVSDILFGWILAGGAWLAGRSVATEATAARLARERADLLEERARMLAQTAAADERMRIAREMHDVVAHSLSVMTLHVGGVRRLLRADQTAEREALGSAETAGREAMDEMHRMVGVLRRDMSGDPTPPPSLRRLDEILELTRDTGVDVRLVEAGRPQPLPPGLERAAYRIVQEALTNIRRHARAHRADVHIEYRPDGLAIDVEDDGVGLTSPESSGHGLLGMRERAAAYGGTVTVGAGDGGGVRVSAWLPVCHEDPVRP
jgi:signal transduction histidine kinase